MLEEITALIELQGVDDELRKVRSAIGEQEGKLDGFKKDLKTLGDSLEQEKTPRDELKKKQREMEAQIEDTTALVKKSESRIMSIGNNREFRALQREIDDNKRRITEMEEELLGYIEQIEKMEATVASLQQECKDMEERFAQDKEEAESRMSENQVLLDQLNATRNSIGGKIHPDLFSTYQRVIKARKGRAVVPVVSYVCRGCNMSIPPQTYNELQIGTEIKYCPHCERIIYWKQEEQEKIEQAS